ncbi:hypothetical protein FNT36_12490 [Hymenobacter setariae]|uniref:DUF4276 family protein n=1 Tax=Hymenobacter setariae TaxID=2594794 RepID=A0A558BUV0_9BACT|nr:hypothetical protein [Hymenobacter setariae]TVT40295.1 hypothetical protein FNT36_12490 [Hymenobacter setariae]
MTLTYGFFGEDEGQARFLEQYLLKVAALYPVEFQAHAWYSKKFKGINNKGVDKGFCEAWLAGFGQAQYRLDCLFIGRDLDAATSSIRVERLGWFADQIVGIDRSDWKASTIFILPMQCLEHWLLALQRHADGKLAKDCRGLESIVNEAVKREVYEEHPRLPAEQTKDELVAELAAGLDIAWLANVSESFRLFHQDVSNYLSARLSI